MEAYPAHRSLTPKFEQDLLDGGLLAPLVDWVKNDNSLALGIRQNRIEIYYRGGKIFKITPSNEGYSFEIDEGYFTPKGNLTNHKIYFLNNAKAQYQATQKNTKSIDSTLNLVSLIPQLKQSIDFKLTAAEENEREYQQGVFRVNSRAKKANYTECFITDIEYSITVKKRIDIDMTGILWSLQQRSVINKWRPVIIEMKYGDGALDKKSGIVSHLQDFATITDRHIEELKASCVYQFNFLKQLNLLQVNQVKDIAKSDAGKPLIIFLLAALSPNSSQLKNILESLEPELIQKIEAKFDLRFYQAHFAGYEIHEANLLTLDEVKALL